MQSLMSTSEEVVIRFRVVWNCEVRKVLEKQNFTVRLPFGVLKNYHLNLFINCVWNNLFFKLDSTIMCDHFYFIIDISSDANENINIRRRNFFLSKLKLCTRLIYWMNVMSCLVFQCLHVREWKVCVSFLSPTEIAMKKISQS